MNRHKQVLEIGRDVICQGCDYSEPNALTRRIKYFGVGDARKKAEHVREVLDAAGLNEVQVKVCNYYHYNGTILDYSIILLEPIAWFNE